MVIARFSAEVVEVVGSAVFALGWPASALVRFVRGRRKDEAPLGCLTNEDIDELLRS